jgi:hypothetical protein
LDVLLRLSGFDRSCMELEPNGPKQLRAEAHREWRRFA